MPQIKVKILLAAAQVALQHGAAHFTMDRVAEVAALSKGGLLYHYPTKRALLEAMLQYVLAQTETRISHHRHLLVSQSRPLAQAIILAESEQDDAERAMSQALLTAAAEDPQLLEPARAAIKRWLADIASESEAGLILLLAVEGLRFLSLLDLLPCEAPTREQLYALLLRTAQHPAS